MFHVTRIFYHSNENILPAYISVDYLPIPTLPSQRFQRGQTQQAQIPDPTLKYGSQNGSALPALPFSHHATWDALGNR